MLSLNWGFYCAVFIETTWFFVLWAAVAGLANRPVEICKSWKLQKIILVISCSEVVKTAKQRDNRSWRPAKFTSYDFCYWRIATVDNLVIYGNLSFSNCTGSSPIHGSLPSQCISVLFYCLIKPNFENYFRWKYFRPATMRQVS